MQRHPTFDCHNNNSSGPGVSGGGRRNGRTEITHFLRYFVACYYFFCYSSDINRVFFFLLQVSTYVTLVHVAPSIGSRVSPGVVFYFSSDFWGFERPKGAVKFVAGDCSIWETIGGGRGARD